MILHSRFRKLLPLLLYGDLLPGEEIRIKRHLAGCEACRIELHELQRLGTLASGVRGIAVDDALISEARSELTMLLSDLRAHRRPSRSESFLETILSPRPAMVFGGAAAVLLAGFLIGRYMFPASGAAAVHADLFADSQSVTLSNVRIIGQKGNGRSGTDAQEIELAFDATRSLRIRGVLGDPSVQRVMAHAILKGDNPGVRIRAAASIDPRADGLCDREIKAALLLAMTTDTNDGVRKAALEALLRYPGDREIRDGLLRMLLADRNPGLRVAAIKGLDTLAARGFEPDAGMRKSLVEHMRNEDNLFVRAKTESILKGTLQ